MSTQTRTQGPDAPGGLPTFSGRAGGKDVFWVAWDEAAADKLENDFVRASLLLQFMIRNAYTLEGLTQAEWGKARQLIETEVEAAGKCCSGGDCKEKPIGDTNLCRGHNLYALANRV